LTAIVISAATQWGPAKIIPRNFSGWKVPPKIMVFLATKKTNQK
jgi:hypothetical protein